MQKLSESQRVSEIEQKWQGGIEKLFYNWHWNDGFTHREIANTIDVPRPTITRWFRQLNISTQDCERPTKRRYQIRLLKILKQIQKKKIHYEKPCLANKHFFKSWGPGMAYVLGYFAADGCMYINHRGSHFIEFTSTDKELIEKVKILISSEHKIGSHKHENSNLLCSYRLQVGSKEMFNDLSELGFTPAKSKTVRLSKIPNEYFSHFVRGFFDGDGCVYFGNCYKNDRQRREFVLSTRFSSGSREFLQELWHYLKIYADIKGGSLVAKEKDDKINYDLQFSKNDSIQLFHFMYKGVTEIKFLERKYYKFQEAFKIINYAGVA